MNTHNVKMKRDHIHLAKSIWAAFIGFTWLISLGFFMPKMALSQVYTPPGAPREMSVEDLEKVKGLLSEEIVGAFSQKEASLLIYWLKDWDLTQPEFDKLSVRLISGVDQYPHSLQNDIAEVMFRYGHRDQSREIYQNVLSFDPLNARALVGTARILFREGKPEESLKLIDHALAIDQDQYDGLYLKAEVLESQGELLKAIDVYEKIQKFYPQSQAAVNLKVRALLDMGANSLALEEIRKSKGEVDPIIQQRVRGNRAMYQIRWEEPETAYNTIKDELKIVAPKISLDNNPEPPVLRLLPSLGQDPEMSTPSIDDEILTRDKIIERALNQLSDDKIEPQSKLRLIEKSLNMMELVSDQLNTTEAWAESSPLPMQGPSREDLLKDLKTKLDFSRKDSDEIEDPYLRGRMDLILVNRQRSEMENVIADYHELSMEGIILPTWAMEAVGDAYLYLRQPEKALEIYEQVRALQPQDHNTRMAIYYALIELGRFKDAERIIYEMDRETPPTIVERGIQRENWQKYDIVLNKAWLLMYQDKNALAEKYINDLQLRAPFNTSTRSAAAHNHFWRGWIRRSLEDFKQINTMDPDNVSVNNGYSLALNANGYKKEARELNAKLLAEYPKNQHLQFTKKLFDIEMMSTLIASASFGREFPGEDEMVFSLRGEQPVHYRDTIFAELLRRETTNFPDNDVINRLSLGNIWKWEPTWKWATAISQEYDTGDNFGWLTNVEFAPDDYWTFIAGYDSHTLDIPLRSRSAGVDATELSLSTRYRLSEQFNTTVGYSYKDLTDDNEIIGYYWNTDTALTTEAYWKTRLGTEFSATHYTRSDVDYFSPDYVYSFLLVPMVEHTWYRHYEKALVDRLYVGAGQQWQNSYGAENIGYVRYEQDYKFSETFSWLWGTQYSLRNYDGGDVNDLGFYTTLRKNF